MSVLTLVAPAYMPICRDNDDNAPHPSVPDNPLATGLGCRALRGADARDMPTDSEGSGVGMIEYRKSILARSLRAKGYRRFAIECFLVLGQASWQVELYNDAGAVLRRLGGPSATYAAVQVQIDTLPGLLPPQP